MDNSKYDTIDTTDYDNYLNKVFPLNDWILVNKHSSVHKVKVNLPSHKIKVSDPHDLTLQEIEQLQTSVKKVNPLADKVSISPIGIAKLEYKYPNTTEYIIPSDLLLQPNEKPQTGLIPLAEKTKINIPYHSVLSDSYGYGEAIDGLRALQKANLYLAHKVKFDIDNIQHSFILTFPDNSTKKIPIEDLYTPSIASTICLHEPQWPVMVKDQTNLDDKDKQEII